MPKCIAAMRAHFLRGMRGALRKEGLGFGVEVVEEEESWEGKAVRAVKRNWRKVIRRPVRGATH